MIEIRRAVPDDAYAIAAISVACWRETYHVSLPKEVLDGLDIDESSSGWKKTIESGGVVYVAEQNSRVLGFGSCCKIDGTEGYKGKIKTLYVSLSSQRQGVGGTLFHTLADHLRKHGMSPFVTSVDVNNAARLFYAKMGGIKIKEAVERVENFDIRVYVYGWER